MALRGDDRRYRILNYIASYIGFNGYGPSIREIAWNLDSSSTSIQYHVDRLVKDGRLTRQGHMSRTLRLGELCP